MNLEFIPKRAFMEEALLLAREAAAHGEIPVGAVVELNGEIIGRGRNTRETGKTPLGHAEINAIESACRELGDWRLKGANLYVTLEPCPMCAGAAINARISRVIFGADDPEAGSCGSVTNLFSLPYGSRPALFPNFMEEECRGLMRDFFKNLRSR